MACPSPARAPSSKAVTDGPGGQSDGSFGTAGLLAIDLFGAYDTPGAMLLQPDGRLVLAGPAYNGSKFGLGVVRVTP